MFVLIGTPPAKKPLISPDTTDTTATSQYTGKTKYCVYVYMCTYRYTQRHTVYIYYYYVYTYITFSPKIQN